MKTLILSFLVLIAFFSGCKKDANSVTGYYESMHFVRQGGGQLDFTVQPTTNVDIIQIMVTKYEFRDTSLQMFIEKNTDNAPAFSSLKKAMNNQMQINGNYHEPAGETGTWAYIYFVANSKETEVTNIALRDTLLKFEQSVRDKMNL